MSQVLLTGDTVLPWLLSHLVLISTGVSFWRLKLWPSRFVFNSIQFSFYVYVFILHLLQSELSLGALQGRNPEPGPPGQYSGMEKLPFMWKKPRAGLQEGANLLEASWVEEGK